MDAIAAFRAALIVFLSKARPLLEETSGEIIRVRQWLENDQRRASENQFRLCWRKFEEARTELFNSDAFQIAGSQFALHIWPCNEPNRAIRECRKQAGMVLKNGAASLDDKTDPLAEANRAIRNILWPPDMPSAIAYRDQRNRNPGSICRHG